MKRRRGNSVGLVVSITALDDFTIREYLIPFTEIVNAGLRVWNRDLMTEAGGDSG